MYLLIIEPDASGHHFLPYVQFFIREAAKRCWKVRLMTTRSSAGHPAMETLRQEMGRDLMLSYMPEVPNPKGTGSISLLLNQYRYFSTMKTGFKALPASELPDLVFVMSLDAVDKVLSILGSPFDDIPFSGMLVSIKYHRFKMGLGPPSRNDRLYKSLFERLLRARTLFSITVIDEFFLEYAGLQKKQEYDKVKFVPDPGELEGSASISTARESLGIPADRFIILVYGSLSKRKGIDKLFEAVSLMEENNISVLLVGEIDEGVKNTLQQPIAKELTLREQLFIVPGYQDKKQEYMAFRSANVVWLGYADNFYGKSAIIPQAGSLGIPVLAKNNGLIGKIVKKNNLGLVFDANNVSVAAKEILRIQSDEKLQSELGENGKRYAKKSSAQEFGKALCSAIKL